VISIISEIFQKSHSDPNIYNSLI